MPERGESEKIASTVEVLALAAHRLEGGRWRWNDGSRPVAEDDRDLFMAVAGAAGLLGRHDDADAALTALHSHIQTPFRAWNNAPGRTRADVIMALRVAALRLPIADLPNAEAPTPPTASAT